jgi:hypothetical protein
MIPPLLLQAIPRLLLFVIPIFINVKVKEKRDDSSEEQPSSPEPERKDT